MAALTMASSRSTATTGATITRVTRKTIAKWTVKVWQGPQGGRGERDDQPLLTGLPFPCTAWECPQRDGSRNQGIPLLSRGLDCVPGYPQEVLQGALRMQKGSAHSVEQSSAAANIY